MNFATFFSSIQETKWYRQFLDPVITRVDINTSLLDVGTGPGKLIQILTKEKQVNCVGIDTNEAMLNQAKIKLKHTKSKLIKVEPNQDYPFKNNTFNTVSICNVLFHLEKESVYKVLNDSKRVLKTNGKIIVLTPTGKGNFFKLTKSFLSIKNRSIYIWFYATKKKALSWKSKNYLKDYCKQHDLKYTHEITLAGFAQLEIIELK